MIAAHRRRYNGPQKANPYGMQARHQPFLKTLRRFYHTGRRFSRLQKIERMIDVAKQAAAKGVQVQGAG
jgi:predicted RNA methylase